MVHRGCWKPRTVHSGATSDMIGRTEKVRFTLLWCCCSLRDRERGEKDRGTEGPTYRDKQKNGNHSLVLTDTERADHPITKCVCFDWSSQMTVLTYILGWFARVCLPSRWPNCKASTSRAEDPRVESRLHRDFLGVESYQ